MIYVLMSWSFFIIFFAMIGYPITLMIIDKIKNSNSMQKNFTFEPNVTYMIVAHNEEKVIYKKLLNALEIEYPRDKFQILVTMDFCTDNTENIVKNFAEKHTDYNIYMYKTKEHKGKTNAQNEAINVANGEIVVMTDANAIMKKNAIRELVSSFSEGDIAYVCGKLIYSNAENSTGKSETEYWNFDMKMRDIESRIQTITAGNG